MASNCTENCSSRKSKTLLTTLKKEGKSKGANSLDSFLKNEKVTVDFGAGQEHQMTVDEANGHYIAHHFPDLGKASYCCPSIFTYKHPRELLESEENDSVGETEKEVKSATLFRERRGELAEEETVEKFFTMLSKYDIPAFVIHGYNWKARYLNNLKNAFPRIKKLLTELFKKEGEIDLLISLPGKCLINVEVKAVEMERYVCQVVDKAFGQCGKTIDFLSQISSLEENIPFINIVAVPNCSKSVVSRLFCSTCSTHIVSETDLSSLDNLYQWFTNLTRLYSREMESSPLDISAHHNLVGRIVGAASLVELRTVHESISWTHDQISDYEMAEKLMKRWCQLSPKQHSVIASDPQFLWLTGPPGTGKTILALWKAVEILKGSTQADASSSNSGSNSVLYIIIETGGTSLKDYYSRMLGGGPGKNCELIIKEAKEFRLLQDFRDRAIAIQQFPVFVHSLQKENPGKIVHIIYDDCCMTTLHLDKSRFIHEIIKLVDMNRLGYVWCIQDSYFNLIESTTAVVEDIPGFQKTHLERVMRMSLQNIEIANTLLFRDLQRPLERELRKSLQNIEIPNTLFRDLHLKPGHAISGQRPIVYRMKCVCIPPKDNFTCIDCHVFRVAWLMRHADYKLRLKYSATKGGFKDIVVLTNNVTSVSDVIGTLRYEMRYEGFMLFILSHVQVFKGCEHHVVIVDLMTLCEVFNAFVALTRCTGQLIFLDAGCPPDFIAEYDAYMNLLLEAGEAGKVEIKEIHPSDSDKEVLLDLWLRDLLGKIRCMAEKYGLDNLD